MLGEGTIGMLARATAVKTKGFLGFLEVKTKKGRTALSIAAAPSGKRPTPVESLKLLVERGALLHQRDERGRTPLDHAKNENRSESVLILKAALA